MSAENQSTSCKSKGFGGCYQKAAYLWFVCAVVGGSMLVCFLSGRDRWMYDNNGEMLDYKAYHDNRQALRSLPSERVDYRQRSELPSE